MANLGIHLLTHLLLYAFLTGLGLSRISFQFWPLLKLGNNDMVVLRLFKAVWFISVIAVAAALLYGYATLQESVAVYEKGTEIMRIERDTFFYIVLGLLTVINVLVFIVAKVVVENNEFRIWFYGLIITFNIFFIIGISFVSLYNSAENYDYSRLEIIIYGSIALFSVWTVGWPLYIGYKKITSQS